MSRTVLVTGAVGFVGHRLVAALAAAGDRPHALVRPSDAGTGEPWRLSTLPAGTPVHRVDLRDAAGVARTLAEVRPEVVFHAAVHSAPQGSPWRRRVADDVLGTAHLLDALDALPGPAPRLVQLTSSLAQAPGDRPLRESDPLAPVTDRGTSQAAVLLLVRRWAGRGGPATVLRPFHVYGPGEPPGRLVSRALVAALDGSPLPVSDAGTRLDPVFVDDVAEACLRASHTEPRPAAAWRDGERDELNVGRGRGLSVAEIVTRVEAVTGRAVRRAAVPHPAGLADGSARIADTSALSRRLGWEPPTCLASGLERTLEWIRRGGPVVEGWLEAVRTGLEDVGAAPATARPAASDEGR